MGHYPDSFPTEHMVPEVVPQNTRHDPLPDGFREWIDRQADLLSDVYYYDYVEEGQDADYDQFKHETFTGDDWKWYGRGSERTVASMGATRKGNPLYGDFRGVVFKFNPWLRPGDGAEEPPMVEKVSESGNLHEIAVWTHAVANDNTRWFAPLLDWSESGDWVAMEQMIPVYRYKNPSFANKNIDFIWEKNIDGSMCDWLEQEMEEAGYDPHTKDGNVGFSPTRGQPVLIDFGAHVGVDEFEDSIELTEYAMDIRED